VPHVRHIRGTRVNDPSAALGRDLTEQVRPPKDSRCLCRELRRSYERQTLIRERTILALLSASQAR
jgi:hypothetical protein